MKWNGTERRGVDSELPESLGGGKNGTVCMLNCRIQIWCFGASAGK